MAEGTTSMDELAVPASRDFSDVLASEQYRCPICNYHSISCAGLMLHLTNEHNDHLDAVCKLCRQVFPSDKIEDHVMRCKGIHACSYCHATFAKPTYLQRHLVRRHHTLPATHQPSCDICKKSFSSAGALATHKRVHNGDLPHSCNLCGARFNQMSHARLHVDMHHAYVELSRTPKPFQCQICGRGFLFHVSLQQHKTQHTKLTQKSGEFECAVCGRMFAYRSELERHTLTHSKKGPHECPFCQKLFKRPNLLKMHILRHTDPDLLTCQFCLRTYSSQSHLTQHICKHEEVSVRELQPAANSSVSSGSPLAELVDFGTLAMDCGLTTVPESFPDELLSDFDCDHLATTSVVSPDISFLHSVLYSNGQ